MARPPLSFSLYILARFVCYSILCKSLMRLCSRCCVGALMLQLFDVLMSQPLVGRRAESARDIEKETRRWQAGQVRQTLIPHPRL